MARRHEDGCQVTGRDSTRISEKGEQFISIQKETVHKNIRKKVYLLLHPNKRKIN